MSQRDTTLLGRRIGYNERKRKEARVQKVKSGTARVARWFKRGGWVLLVAVVAIAVVLWQERFYLQRFNPLELRHLQYVEIEGNRMLSWEDVMQNAQVETGMLMSELNADSVASNLMLIPLISSVEVEKRFPSSLYIKLQESSPVLSVLDQGKAKVFSEKGISMPLSMATAMRLPVLDNGSLDKVEVIATFLDTMRKMDNALYEDVSQVGWDEENKAVEVFFRDVGYRVLYPASGWQKEDFALYESLGEGFAKDLHCAGEVDMRFHGFAYVRNFDKRCVNG
ncbi:MAG: FtsQ-type POTRA domain-containing protein [Fibrobacter sp.]|nr:FtsQ-type POTRA domain-containing protein [Fibrobacter sp.]